MSKPKNTSCKNQQIHYSSKVRPVALGPSGFVSNNALISVTFLTSPNYKHYISNSSRTPWWYSLRKCAIKSYCMQFSFLGNFQ